MPDTMRRILPRLAISLILITYSALSPAQDAEFEEAYLKPILTYSIAGHTDSLNRWIDSAMVAGQRLNMKDIEHSLFSEMGSYALSAREVDQAIYWYYRSIRHKQASGFEDICTDETGLAIVFLERGNIDSAGYHLQLAHDNWNSLYPDSINSALQNISGWYHMDQGFYDTALEYYLKGLKMAEKRADTSGIIYICLNMGTLYGQIDRPDESLESYLRSLRLSSLINHKIGMASSYSIGIIYQNRGEYEEALRYYTEAIPACIELGRKDDLANIYNNMSNVYMLLKQFDKAVQILRPSIRLSIEEGNRRQLGIGYANLGKTYELMGRLDSAQYYYQISEQIMVEIKALRLQSLVVQMKAYAYEKAHNFEEAYYTYLDYDKLADSIINERVEQQVEDLKLKYETKKKEELNRQLQLEIGREKERSRFLYMISLILVLLGLLSILLFILIRRHAVTRRKLAEAEARQLEAEVEAQKRELSLYALSISKNLEFVNNLIEDLKELSENVDEKGVGPLNRIVGQLKQQHNDSGWKEFEKRFSDIHQDFYQSLLTEYPDLTLGEIKLSAFLKLGMNTKEICAITFQSVRAVEAARLRLRKKLRLQSGENLTAFFQKY